MDSHFDLIIIGGDAAGMSAASQARRHDPAMTIAVFEKTDIVSYAACGMPYYIAGDVPTHEKLLAIDVNEYIQKRKISIFTRSEAVKVDFAKKTVTVNRSDGPTVHSYGKLVIATGASALVPPIDGVGLPGVFFLRSLSDGVAIRNRIDAGGLSRALILGGGFIGLEMVEAFSRRGLETRIVERLPSPGMSLTPAVREMIMGALEAGGVRVSAGVEVSAITPSAKGLSIRTSNGEFEGDILLISAGVRPNTGFLEGTGIAMNDRGAIVVDERSRTNVPDVFAAGDCATVKHLVTGKDTYMPLGTTANKQGRVAGLQAAGEKGEVFPGIVGSQFVKVFDLEIGKTGLNDEDAAREGIEIESKSVTWRSRAGYYPGSKSMRVTLTARKDDGRLIGGEVAGTDLAALRADVIAASITAGMKASDLAYLDLGYAPPFSPVWDPINAAGQLFVKRQS